MKVKDLLKDPSAWTRGRLAQDRDGKIVSPFDPSACCFCLLGAMFRCYPEDGEKDAAFAKLKQAITEHGYRFSSVVGFNDRVATHAEILTVLETADI